MKHHHPLQLTVSESPSNFVVIGRFQEWFGLWYKRKKTDQFLCSKLLHRNGNASQQIASEGKQNFQGRNLNSWYYSLRSSKGGEQWQETAYHRECKWPPQAYRVKVIGISGGHCLSPACVQVMRIDPVIASKKRRTRLIFEYVFLKWKCMTGYLFSQSIITRLLRYQDRK